MTSNVVYLNGQFIDKQKAMISAFDRGFLFGDGLYDVIPCYYGKAFAFEQHLERFNDNLLTIGIQCSYATDDWRAIAEKLLQLQQHECCSLYLQVTRGVQIERRHLPSGNEEPTIMATTFAFAPPSIAQLSQGYHVLTVADPRSRYSSLKSISHLPNILVAQTASQHNCQEVIMIRDGYAIEGMSSNLFICKNGTLFTPPTGPALVGGITREIIIQLSKKLQIPVKETAITVGMLNDADEIWLTGSTKEIVPATKLNDAAVCNGQGGPLWRIMIEAYREHRDKQLGYL